MIFYRQKFTWDILSNKKHYASPIAIMNQSKRWTVKVYQKLTLRKIIIYNLFLDHEDINSSCGLLNDSHKFIFQGILIQWSYNEPIHVAFTNYLYISCAICSDFKLRRTCKKNCHFGTLQIASANPLHTTWVFLLFR